MNALTPQQKIKKARELLFEATKEIKIINDNKTDNE